jgi:hypothetical protein
MTPDRPLYYVEGSNDDPGVWRVVGPNGVVDSYRVESEAQSRADRLNEDVAEEIEDDS